MTNSCDRIEFEGVVVESNKDKFKVQINDNYFVTCTLSGKIRQNSVRILVGDKIVAEICKYDPSKGRIKYRKRN